MQKPPIFTAAVLLCVALTARVLWAYQAAGPAQAPAGTAEKPAPAAAPKPVNDPAAAALLRQARDTLYTRNSVQAQVTQTVAVAQYQFRGQGRYLAEKGLKHRLEYTVELNDLRGEFLEVCDSQLLHTSRKITEIKPIPGAPSAAENDFRRRDIQRIRLALREQITTPDDPEAIRNLEVGLGGLPAVLASLERTLILEGVKPETLDGRQYQLIQGKLNVDRAQELLNQMGALAGQVAGLLPDLVRVYFAQDTLFPEKILYLKQADEAGTAFRPMVLVEFTDVRIDQPLPVGAFDYPDPGSVERDETDAYLKMLGAPVKPAAPAIKPVMPVNPVNPGFDPLNPVAPPAN